MPDLWQFIDDIDADKQSSTECLLLALSRHSADYLQCPLSDMTFCNANVRYWHLADIALGAQNVRFRGQSGHHSGKSGHQKCPLMTQSGHLTSI
jgi:hypothetical protein